MLPGACVEISFNLCGLLKELINPRMIIVANEDIIK